MTLSDSVGGFFHTPSVKLSAKTYGGFHDSDPFYDVRYPGLLDISDMKAFLFYVKCAAPHPQKPTCSAIRFNLHTSKDNVETWTLLGNSSILAMEKGTGVWKSYAAHGDGNGIVDLPVNFEGYILVEIGKMLTNPIAEDMEGRRLISSTFQFQAVGGECGDGYIGPLYMITEMEGKNNKIVTFDDCDVFSIATDSYATDNDLLNIGPVVGRTYDAFPLNTVETYPEIRAVTKDSAVIEWQPTEKAAQYRVDVYTEDTSTGTFAYINAFTRDAQFPQILSGSLTEMLYRIPIILVFSLVVAMILNQDFKGRSVMRSVFFIPLLISSGVIASIIKTSLTSTVMSADASDNLFNAALLTNMLYRFGLPDNLVSTIGSLVSNVTDLVWSSSVQIIVFIMGLMTIPVSHYEVARVEGATAWETFWYVTFPSVFPYIFVNLVYTVIDHFVSYDNAVMKYIMSTAYKDYKYSYAAAMSWIYFIMIIAALGVMTWAVSLISPMREKKVKR